MKREHYLCFKLNDIIFRLEFLLMIYPYGVM